MPKYNTCEELLEKAKTANNHRISYFNVNNRSLSKSNKGVIGQIVEEGIFEYPVNSRSEADFKDLGVELKVTGIKKLKDKKIACKERLVLNIINYMNEHNISFEDSSFWRKNKKLLIMLYLYDNERNNQDFIMLDSFFHEYSDIDLAIIKNDYKIIQDKINKGLAHEISEADTMYLGACTKGADAESNYRTQPYSNLKARQRAYCLKQSYMTSVLRSKLSKERQESIFKIEDIINNTFEILMESKLKPYYGKSEKELFKMFNLEKINSKNKYNTLVGRMLGINGNINNSEEFQKANIQLKTIRVEENNKIKEHMSFPTYKYTEIVKEEWETSEVKSLFESTKFMFVVFKKKDGEYYFEKIKFWNMPISILEKEVREIWIKTVDLIKSGNIVKKVTPSKIYVNLPGTQANHIFHTRPHDSQGIRKTGKGYELPVKDKVTGYTKYTKYCFWLDKEFILGIIE